MLWADRSIALTQPIARIIGAVVLSTLLSGCFTGEPGGRAAPTSQRAQAKADRNLDELAVSYVEEARKLSRTLNRQVVQAPEPGAQVQAAVMLSGWESPVAASTEPGGVSERMRMWSMSKVLTAVALLRELGWGEQRGEPIPTEVASALRGALVRSENCRQRRLVLELQNRLGGTEATVQALDTVLKMTGAEGDLAVEAQAPLGFCQDFLSTQEVENPFQPALLLGTATWRIGDAVRFMHALGEDEYGRAASRLVLHLLREPKLPSREISPGQLTFPLDWGAGTPLADFDPAYKAGWGGVQQQQFMAGQIAFARLTQGRGAAIAVMAHPGTQPIRDDPGITTAPYLIESVLHDLKHDFRDIATESATRPDP